MVLEERLQMFACILNSQLMEIPYVYLGISVGENFKRKLTWKLVLDKIKLS